MGFWRAECTAEDSHTSMGARGYWPVHARREGHWFQVATTEGPQNSALLRMEIKPLLDAIMAWRAPPPLQRRNATEFAAAAAQLERGFSDLFGAEEGI